ncbi:MULTISPECIES: sensor domain-containing protein [unclassified Janthinobacterium]|uniref:sensor domain-containing protein n=1 Tax=unclassified Janthinobacterium TaxID=2610881 RepID=UPI00036BC3EC|nr:MULTISPECIES: EAL domain-containing protein [unclassified Janthinobacterium]MEC5159715.1 diguanylate cyclase (GGDEF)-like protein/PAS domain S-box-containing protein [Janthinobacterium sp. CG_S6]
MSDPILETGPAPDGDAAAGAGTGVGAGTEVGAGTAQDALELLSGLVTAIDRSPILAVRSVDRGGAVRYWSGGCAELYGTPAALALGRPDASLLSHGEQDGEFAAAVEQVWRSGQAQPARDWQVRSAAGRLLWIYASLFPVFRGGVLQQVYCVEIDVSARRRQEDALRAAGDNFRQLFEKSSDAIVLLEGVRIVDVNPAAVALFHCHDKGRMAGRVLCDFSPLLQPDGGDSLTLEAQFAERAHQNGNCRFDWRYRRCDGAVFWAEVLLTSITYDHSYLFYAVIRDISARKAAERSLHLAAQVFENARDAILVTDAERRVVAVNRAYLDVTGFDAHEMLGRRFRVQRAGADEQAFFQQVWAGLAASEHWQGEIEGKRKNGQRYPAWLSLTAIRDSAGAVSNYMGIVSDITERKKSEAHTRHLAEHDFLTDLPNRVLLLDRLSLALAAARRKHSMLATLFLDLDHFKNINDTMGHRVGDLLLKEVARRLIKCVRGVDTVSRQGGDEFVIILADLGGVDQAAHVAASVQHAVSQPYQIDGHELYISTSIGVSIFPSDGGDIDTLVKNADIAMYHAKEGGRNGYQFFNAEMNAQIVERVSFENGLRQAIARGEFILEYQPEIDIASGAMVGAEALIRWRHPQLGLLKPERFVGVAEECGLMVPIGDWVLRQACAEARRWHDGGHPLVVAVNLSASQFMHRDLALSVAEALRAGGLAPALLELEVTEAVIMKGGAKAVEILAALRRLGVKLTIDDFGTGYSRLGQLRHYPIDKLKIDQSFLGAMKSDPDDASVVTTIIAMAKGLKLKVIAEGVETAEQLAFLRGQGCDQYQGFYASSAVLAAELGKLMR